MVAWFYFLYRFVSEEYPPPRNKEHRKPAQLKTSFARVLLGTFLLKKFGGMHQKTKQPGFTIHGNFLMNQAARKPDHNKIVEAHDFLEKCGESDQAKRKNAMEIDLGKKNNTIKTTIRDAMAQQAGVGWYGQMGGKGYYHGYLLILKSLFPSEDIFNAERASKDDDDEKK